MRKDFEYLQKEEVYLETEGKGLEVGFNPKYFLDSLKVIEDVETYIYFGTEISPAILRPIEGEEYIYMILPIKLKE